VICKGFWHPNQTSLDCDSLLIFKFVFDFKLLAEVLFVQLVIRAGFDVFIKDGLFFVAVPIFQLQKHGCYVAFTQGSIFILMEIKLRRSLNNLLFLLSAVLRARVLFVRGCLF
jgi:hypothetical protein